MRNRKDTSGSSMRLFSVGQTLMEEDVRKGAHPDFHAIRSLAQSADVAFTNFEGTIRSGYPMKVMNLHGIEPSSLDFFPWMGFRLLSLANNHAFDYGPTGLLATLEETRRRDLIGAGIGHDLTEAAMPAYLDTSSCRAALIAMTDSSILPEIACATDELRPGMGRPGVNPLRHESIVQTVMADEWCNLKALGERIGFNLRNAREVACGWEERSEGSIWFAGTSFSAGRNYVQEVNLHQADRVRLFQQIQAAVSEAKYVFVSFHDHMWAHSWQEVLPWKRAFARACIDAGAHAFLGHGVPALSGIEIYKGCPIFYSLGNFIFHETPGKWHVPEVWESVGVVSDFEESQVTSVELIPLVLGDCDGRCDVEYGARRYPLVARGKLARKILRDLVRLSTPLGTKIQIRKDVGIVEL